ncbi:MAG: DUF2867 domain-containing protein [Parvularculaceae bacterium]|nr:DUF2867 domain-containing protein [Parvularculaceae bacterium]
MQARPYKLPSSSRLADCLPRHTYLDCFAVAESVADQPITAAYIGVLGHLPPWFKRLLILRTRLVAPFGLKGPTRADLDHRSDAQATYAVGDHLLRWPIADLSEDEVIAGFDDRHLDFQVSVMRDRAATPPVIALSTAVRTNNAFGRAYLAAIKPFHRFGVAHLLSSAAAAGRI